MSTKKLGYDVKYFKEGKKLYINVSFSDKEKIDIEDIILAVEQRNSTAIIHKDGSVTRRDFSCCDTQSVIQYAVLHSTCNNKIRTRYHKTTRNEKRTSTAIKRPSCSSIIRG